MDSLPHCATEVYLASAEDWAEYARWAEEIDHVLALREDDWPHEKTAEDRRRDRAEVERWYQEHAGD